MKKGKHRPGTVTSPAEFRRLFAPRDLLEQVEREHVERESVHEFAQRIARESIADAVELIRKGKGHTAQTGHAVKDDEHGRNQETC